MEFGTLTHLLSWDLYTRFFNFLFEYGFYYVPLVIFLYQHYISLLGKDSNTSISAVSINRMQNSILIYVVIFFIAALPMINASDMEEFKSELTPHVKVKQHLSTDRLNDNAKQTYDAFKAKQKEPAKIPLAFAAYDLVQHSMIVGTKDLVAQLPINDIRSEILTTMQNNAIKTPEVRRNYNDFATQCFYPAKNRFDALVESKDITPDTGWFDGKSDIPESDYDWAGGDYYLENAGFYRPCTSATKESEKSICDTHSELQFIHKNKPYSCLAGWDWLYPQLTKEFNIDEIFPLIELGGVGGGSKTLKKHVVRSFLSAEKVVDEEEASGFSFVAAIKASISWVVGLVGAGATALLKIITTYLITLIIPLVQAMLLFVIVVLLPIILPLSAFKIEYLFTIFATMFGIQFVTVIIAIISIIDNSLLMLYSAGSGSDNGFMQAVHIAGSGAGLEFFLINLLILLFYIIAIKLWFGLMVEFGTKGMDALTSVDDMGLTAPGMSGAKTGGKAAYNFLKK